LRHAAAGGDATTVGLGLLDVAQHPGLLLGRHQRPAAGIRVRGVPDGKSTDRRRSHLTGLVVMRARYQHPGGQRTALPGVHQCADTAGQRCVHVGVVEYQVCRLATELEHVALHGVAGEVLDQLADRGSVASPWAMSLSDAGTMLTTPAGMSVFSAMMRPHLSALHGVSMAGLSTIVFPVARIWPTLLLMISNGKFHGVVG